VFWILKNDRFNISNRHNVHVSKIWKLDLLVSRRIVDSIFQLWNVPVMLTADLNISFTSFLYPEAVLFPFIFWKDVGESLCMVSADNPNRLWVRGLSWERNFYLWWSGYEPLYILFHLTMPPSYCKTSSNFHYQRQTRLSGLPS
jgi:hypothetical protein